jgi:uncharacterized caspase-like protein
MIKKFIILFTFILILPIINAEERRGISVIPRSPTGHVVRGNQWLFVIGINTYIDWPRLNSAVNDAKTVRNVLLDRYHFDQHHLIELYDEEATRSNILAKLRYLANRVGPDDSIVIFYSGHGHLDSITNEGSWIPVESSREDISAWISNYDIKSYLKIDAIKAKHILLISDSCFSGDFFRGHKGKLPDVNDKVIKKAYELSSRQAITSGGLEPVVDAGFEDNSIFTYFLAKSLSENNKPFLIPSEFFPDIKAGVVENAEQLPRFGTIKNTGGQQGGELVFFLKQYGSDVVDKVNDRQATLERLKELDSQAKAAKKKEQADIALKEEEIAKLDMKIMELKERLGTTAANADDSLDTMLAIVRQKKEQAKRLEELRLKKEAEEKERLFEIEKLKREQAKKRYEMLKEDIRKYEKIVSLEHSRKMMEAAWNNLKRSYPEARGLAIGDTNGLKRNIFSTKTNLRSSYRKLSVSQVQSIPHILIRRKADWGFYGHSTITYAYDSSTIAGDNVIVNYATDLMWHQSGSDNYMSWNKVKDWIRSLNKRGYAGYHDWRLPTVEEAASLMKENPWNAFFEGTHVLIPPFSNKQTWIWTGDKKDSFMAWCVNFGDDHVRSGHLNHFYYVRPVRSMK